MKPAKAKTVSCSCKNLKAMRTNQYQFKATTTILLSTLFNRHILCIDALLSGSSLLVLIPSHSDLESIRGCHLVWWEKHCCVLPLQIRVRTSLLLNPRGPFLLSFPHLFLFSTSSFLTIFIETPKNVSKEQDGETRAQNVFSMTHLKTGRNKYSLALELLDWDIFMKSKRSHSPGRFPSPVF